MGSAELAAWPQEKKKRMAQVPHGVKGIVHGNQSFGKDICSVFEAHLHCFLSFGHLQIQTPFSLKSLGLGRKDDH